jgi:hypothetical protein
VPIIYMYIIQQNKDQCKKKTDIMMIGRKKQIISISLESVKYLGTTFTENGRMEKD